jgi:hypothetical protein
MVIFVPSGGIHLSVICFPSKKLESCHQDWNMRRSGHQLSSPQRLPTGFCAGQQMLSVTTPWLAVLPAQEVDEFRSLVWVCVSCYQFYITLKMCN